MIEQFMKLNDLNNIDPVLQETIRKIRLVAFDFDGVFTDNMVYVLQDGTEVRKRCAAVGVMVSDCRN
jgi:hypothetical protein